MDDYQLGYQAFTRDEEFDGTRSFSWRRGYRDARDSAYDQKHYAANEEPELGVDYYVA
jgi:hypothetical protein